MIRHCAYCGRPFSYNHEEKCRKGKRGRKELYNYSLELAKTLGIPIRFFDGPGSYSWNGEHIPFPPDLVGSDHVGSLRIVLHEMAHWLYATPEERRDPSFGLGPGDNKRELNVYAIEALLDKKSSVTAVLNLLNEIRQQENVIRRNPNSSSQG